VVACPSCGKEMVQGFFGCETNEFTPPAWFRKKSALGAGGERLGPDLTLSGIAYFEGVRCADCRTVLFKY